MRDFFYNKGDVLITILIVLVAATVIYFRVGVVMGDSDPGERIKNFFVTLISSSQTAEEPLPDAQAGEDGQGSAQEDEPGGQTETPAQDTADTQQETPPPADEDPGAQETPPPEEPDVTTAGTTITINAGDSASTIADKLLSAGAITDKQAFLAEVSAQKADSRLKQGTFSIPEGSSMNDIIAILTG